MSFRLKYSWFYSIFKSIFQPKFIRFVNDVYFYIFFLVSENIKNFLSIQWNEKKMENLDWLLRIKSITWIPHTWGLFSIIIYSIFIFVIIVIAFVSQKKENIEKFNIFI
jgi:hypothetical protein